MSNASTYNPLDRPGSSEQAESSPKELGELRDELRSFKSKFKLLKDESQDGFGKMESRFKQVEKRFAEAEKNVDDIVGTKVDKAWDKLESKQINSIQFLGIFVALFTFVSGSFQIYRMIDNINSAVVFTVLIAALSVFILFTIALILFMSRDNKYSFLWASIILIVSLTAIIGSLYFFKNDSLMKKQSDPAPQNQIINNLGKEAK